MNRILVLLKDPERSAMAFDRHLPVLFPDLSVTSVGPDQAGPHIADADMMITLGVHLADAAADLFAQARRLRWVQVIGTGTDNVAIHLTNRPEVALTNVRGIHGDQMSEAALAAMLSLARDLPRLARNQTAQHWERFPARLLAGHTVGILGLGAIASALAPRCQALGMRVVGIGSTPRDIPGFDRVVARADLAVSVAELDYLVLLTPYSPDTHHIIDKDVLSAMKPGAFLVNLARGGVVDEDALLEALQAGRIAGAALDVFAQEPLPADHPFWGLSNIIITPHVAGFHQGYADQVLSLVADNLRRYRDSGADALINIV